MATLRLFQYEYKQHGSKKRACFFKKFKQHSNLSWKKNIADKKARNDETREGASKTSHVQNRWRIDIEALGSVGRKEIITYSRQNTSKLLRNLKDSHKHRRHTLNDWKILLMNLFFTFERSCYRERKRSYFSTPSYIERLRHWEKMTWRGPTTAYLESPILELLLLCT